MLDTILRAFFLYFFALVCFRIMGFRSFGNMEPYDFVIVLAIGEIIGAPLIEHAISPWLAIVAISTLTGLQIVLSYIAMKNSVFRKIIEGQPVPVIKDGKILYDNLRNTRFTIDDLNEELRVQGVSSPGDVKLANLEPSGRFSIILKKENEPLTARFLKIPTSFVVIENGIIDFAELEKTPLTLEGLEDRLRTFKITDLQYVESAIIDGKGNFSVQVISGKHH